MSRGSLKKTIHLEKKLKLIPLPTSKQNNNSERRGIHNSFFTDEEFNQLRYFRFFFLILFNKVSILSRHPRPSDDYRFRRPKGLVTTKIISINDSSGKTLPKRPAKETTSRCRPETVVPKKKPKLMYPETVSIAQKGMFQPSQG